MIKDQLKNFFRVFLSGDVMIGRGIDQILSSPSQPQLYEPFISNAREYVFLAENANGKIPYPVKADYIWGDALKVWNELKPNVKIINLETAVTQSNEYCQDKEIHYRMHPGNIAAIQAAGIDVCALANNHILDWGYAGLIETLATLKKAGIHLAGAGESSVHAMQPAIFELDLQNRVLIFSVAMPSSGTPSTWGAATKLPGVYYLPDPSPDLLTSIAENIRQYKQQGDLIIFSIHWGSNWGYGIADSFRSFAKSLIDEACVDVVYGHSSHHFRPVEMYLGKPILYGCGDFINDYEGIRGYENYRDDLTLMIFLDFEKGSLQFKKMTLIPMQMKKFRLHYAAQADCEWVCQTFNSFPFGLQLTLRDQSLIYENP